MAYDTVTESDRPNRGSGYTGDTGFHMGHGVMEPEAWNNRRDGRRMAKPASAESRSQPAHYMTYEQFLAWADEDTREQLRQAEEE